MQSPPHYSNAPITEAIIDLRYSLPEHANLEMLQATRFGEEERYPKSNEMYSMEGSFTFEKGATTASTTQHEKIGYRFASADGKGIWQSRLDGFTFSRLAPYESWLPFVSEAERLWKIVRRRTDPVRIERVAVRYINRIDIGSDERFDLHEFFATRPEVGSKLPYDMSGFFMQIRLELPGISSQAIVNQTMVEPSREGVFSFILDIEVIREVDAPQTDEDIWEFFEKLHTQKNEVFEASITDKTRKLIQ